MKTLLLVFGFFLTLPSILAQEKWTCYTDDKLLLVDDHQIQGVFEHSDGSIWFVTDRGIDIYDGQGWSRIDKGNELMRKNIGAFLVDSKNQVWIGTGSPEYYTGGYAASQLYKGGLLVYDGKEWKPILTKDIGINAPIVTKIFEQSNGDIWVGVSNVSPGVQPSVASRGAILRYSEGEWSIFKSKDLLCLSCEFVKGFHEDKNGRLWLWGDRGMAYFKDGTFHPVNQDDGYLKGTQKTLIVMEDSQGNFWVAGYGRVARYDGSQWTTFTRKHGVPSSSFPPSGLTETNDNKMVLTTRNGLYHFDGKDSWVHEKVKYALGATYIDESGKFWIPTVKGLVIKEENNSTMDKDLKSVWDIMPDKNDGLWFFTARDGAKRLRNGEWSHFNKDNKLPSDKVRFRHLADDGTLWLVTNKGICKCEYE